MDSKQLKLVCANYVVESKMTKPAKLQMLEFIQHQATETQLKALILDGKIVNLDEQAEEIVNDRFSVISEAGLLGNILGLVLAAPLWALWRGLASTFSDAHIQCGRIKISNDRDACIAQARIGYAKKRIELLKKAGSNCGKYKNPEVCKKVITLQIAKEEKKMKTYQQKMQKLSMKGRVSATGPSKMTAIRI